MNRTKNQNNEQIAQCYVVAPLINFTSEVPEIKFSSNVSITLPNNEEKGIIEGDLSTSVLSHLPVLHEWQFVIRSVMHLSMVEDQLTTDEQGFQSGPYQCCSALRLLKEGTVGLGPQYLMVSPPLKLAAKLGGANTA